MEFQLNYFKSYKMMLLKCCTQYVSKFGKLSSGHRTGKGQFSFQFQRRAVPKNVQTTGQLHSLHMLARLRRKSFNLGFGSMWTEKFQMYKLDLEKAEEQISNVSIHWIIEKAKEFQKTISASLTTWNSLTVWITSYYGKFLKRWEYKITLPVSWETCMQVRKQQLELNMEQQTGSKYGKEVC